MTKSRIPDIGDKAPAFAIGALDQEGTRLAGYAAFTGGVAVMSIGALLFILFPEPIARLLTNEPAYAAILLRETNACVRFRYANLAFRREGIFHDPRYRLAW